MDDGVGDDEDDTPDEALTLLCTPQARRCLAENSPLFDRCDASGAGYVRGACEAAHICRAGQCVPFTCAPARAVCVGPDNVAVCAQDGLSVEAPSACEPGKRCQAGRCVDPCEQAARESSYIGCAYTAIELENVYRANPESQDHPFALVMANPDPLRALSVWVSDAEGAPAPLIAEIALAPPAAYRQAPPATARTALLRAGGDLALGREPDGSFRLPPEAAAVLLMAPPDGGGLIGPLRVRSDQPVVAYQFSPYCCNFSATNDASLLLPDATLGQRYRALSYPAMQFAGAPGVSVVTPYLTLVAGAQAAQVSFTSKAAPLVVEGDASRAPALTGELTMAPYERVTLRVPASLVYAPQAQADLSGALISSDVPISAFVGHPCTNAPQDQRACDHLEEQLLPAETLGQRYLLQHVRRRNLNLESQERVYWRLVADEDARITFSPPLRELAIGLPSNRATPDCRALMDEAGVLSLAQGHVCEFGAQEALSLESDAPLVVGGVLSGQESTKLRDYGSQAGDPALFLAPPVEQYRRDYSFVTPPTFRRTYASIAIPAGEPLALGRRQVLASEKLERQLIEAGDGRWEVYQLALGPGLHQLSASAPFGLIVYAYDDYVSYAFPGGLDLRPRKKE